MATLTPETRQSLDLLSTDFVFYAEKLLHIRSKSGAIQPLVLNRAQLHIHDSLERQLKETGKVRALILKGRQQGCSTYVEARFFHKTVWKKGIQTYILTHEDQASTNIYQMATRFLENLPATMKLGVNTQNTKELRFAALDSGYKVGTAGNRYVGRSSTIQLFHGSEVAQWRNAEEHAAGIMQAIPKEDGTESILESTAYGMGNFFHKEWQAAERGESQYIAIFVPWFWQEEYTDRVSEGFELTPNEQSYMQSYGLNLGQMAWRRGKISELGRNEMGLVKFMQEYPANSTEAFQTAGEDSLIKALPILSARKNVAVIEEKSLPLIVGIDPARFGKDRTSIIRRRGRVAYRIESYSGLDNVEIANICVKIINDEKPEMLCIDSGGGAGTIDILKHRGYEKVIEEVNFGGKATDDVKYHNKRAEMWDLLRDWLESPPCRIPDSDSLHADLMAPGYKYDANSRLLLEKKEDIKKRGLSSPDEGDALALTFAVTLRTKPNSAPLRFHSAYGDGHLTGPRYGGGAGDAPQHADYHRRR